MEQDHRVSSLSCEKAPCSDMVAQRTSASSSTGGPEVAVVGAVGRVRILEEPFPRAKFRYEAELLGPTIKGARATAYTKTFPKIQVSEHRGAVVVVISCVTRYAPHRPHPHSLVGAGCEDGVYRRRLVCGDDGVLEFPGLRVIRTKRRQLADKLRLRSTYNVDPFMTGFGHQDHVEDIDVDVVRLCFQVFLGDHNEPLPPVVSQPIFDGARPPLRIHALSQPGASVAGHHHMMLLCGRVREREVPEVWFYEEADGVHTWSARADVLAVHNNTAIAILTPAFRTVQTSEPVQVFVQLRYADAPRMASEPWPFTLLPASRCSICADIFRWM
ncbi:hypothetical protein ONE63_004690 [Megalurothrips usitatus]|uniref:RHD domain-containing protein n=1 Tax=Megalurothrips usitatus TaxID=439358 RepID=A0AAV7X4P9_9NEOP|nr:hypothetical protein ONE63_004690 [Megalurothrips usitatus]